MSTKKKFNGFTYQDNQKYKQAAIVYVREGKLLKKPLKTKGQGKKN